MLRRRWHARSKNGCLTCKERHVRCDERRPFCMCLPPIMCIRLVSAMDGNQTPPQCRGVMTHRRDISSNSYQVGIALGWVENAGFLHPFLPHGSRNDPRKYSPRQPNMNGLQEMRRTSIPFITVPRITSTYPHAPYQSFNSRKPFRLRDQCHEVA